MITPNPTLECGDAQVIGDEFESHPTRTARRFVVTGGVQGLGVRPAIYRLATELELAGQVQNTSRGVEIEVEGAPSQIAKFERLLSKALPGATQLIKVESCAVPEQGCTGFTIVRETGHGPLATRVPLDRNVCPECLHEVEQSRDRRHSYAFTSCTLCGPRFTIIRSMPFERDETVMRKFPLCDGCLREFHRPNDRRFHAQTIACPSCGPDLWSHESGNRLHGVDALRSVVRAIESGKIVAIRGLGGYQLVVDATNEMAVQRLRERKGRRAKPLAVMAKTAEAADRLAHVGDRESLALADPAGPIVLCRARTKNGMATSVHPQLDTLGVMLPTTPLHALLAHSVNRPLVCTSANREGEPLEYTVSDADQRLAGVCDVWLHHNRDIVRPIDDSVVRLIADRRVTIRLARGMAPLPLNLPTMPPTLALGGFLKAAAAWSNGSQAVLGPHIGDQESLPARERTLQHLSDMHQLYRFHPETIVHDMHPEYFSTQWAQRQGVKTLAVQHHHAHVVAGMLEHGWLNRRVLGVAWDGTGFGTDGTIWGGEFLDCTSKSFERVARLRPFDLPGGEAAIREPWRIAVAVGAQLGIPIDLSRWPGWNVTPQQVEAVSRIIDRPHFSTPTSSAGRLIDAAASMILGVDRADFDGQAAMRLEAAADPDAKGWYDFPLSECELAELDWRPMFRGMVTDLRRGTDGSVIAMRFHRSLAHGIVRVCQHWREFPIVLTGGVFQNRLLTELVAEMYNNESHPLGLPGIIPPNDGGLAAGQLAIAAALGGFVPCA